MPIPGIVNTDDIKHKILFKRILDINTISTQLNVSIKLISKFFTYDDQFIKRVLSNILTDNEKNIESPKEEWEKETVGIVLKEMLDGFNNKEKATNYQKITIRHFTTIKQKDDGHIKLNENNNEDALLVYRYLKKIVISVVDISQKLDDKYKKRICAHVQSIENFKETTTTENLIKDYKHFFSQFVFHNDSTALGVGAFIISLIVVYVTPYHDEIMNTYLSLSHNLHPFLNSLLENKTNPFLSLDYTSIIDNINNLTDTKPNSNGNSKNTKYVKEFHQKPFLLGLYAFLIKQNTGGTCQDNTLIQLISDDKQKQLSGFSIASNYEDISHWFNNACSNTRLDYKKQIRITNPVRPKSALGKRQNDNKVFSELLFKANTSTPIDQNDYNSRANIFLSMTLSHVYRHTLFSDQKVELVNYKNGIAFDENFVVHLINSIITDTYSITSNNTRSKNTNSIKTYTFNIDSGLIINILNRNIDKITDSIKTQEVKDDFNLNIQMGGSRNPFDSLIKKHIDIIKNKRDLKRFVKYAIKEDPKLQNKIINYYLTHQI